MKKQRRWLKRLLWAAVVVVALVVALFLYVNNGAFVKRHVLPRVSTILGEPVTASAVSFNLFGRFELQGLQVGQAASPLVAAKTIRARWQVMPLLRRQVVVDEVLVDALAVSASDADVQRILARLASQSKPRQPTEKKPSTPGQLPGVTVRQVQVRDLNVFFRQGDQTITVKDLDVTLPELRSGGPFTVTIATALGWQGPPGEANVGPVAVTVAGALDDQLMPTGLTIETKLDLTAQVSGNRVSAKGVNVTAKLPGLKTGGEVTCDIATELAWQGAAGSARVSPVQVALRANLDPQLQPTGATLKTTLDLTAQVSGNDIAAKGVSVSAKLPGLQGGDFAVDVAAALDWQGPTGRMQIAPATLRLTGGLDAQFMPTGVELAGVAPLAGKVGPVPLDGRRGQLTASIVREGQTLRLARFEASALHGETVDGQLALTGTVALQPLGADLQLTAGLPRPDLLNLVGSLVKDFQFGQTTLAYQAHVTAANGGQQVALQGELAVKELTVSSAALKLAPLAPLTITSTHQVALDRQAGVLTLEALKGSVLAGGREAASLVLDRPATVAFGAQSAAGPAVSPATLRLATDRLDLALLRPLVPVIPGPPAKAGAPPGPAILFAFGGGLLDTSIRAVVSDGGKAVEATGKVAVSQLAATVMDAPLADLRGAAEFALNAVMQPDLGPAVTVSKLDVVAGQGAAEWSHVELQSPVTVTLPPGQPPQATPVSVRLAGKLGLAVAKPFVPASVPVKLDQSAASYDLTVRAEGLTQLVTVRGSAGVEGLGAIAGPLSLAGIGASSDFALECRDLAKLTIPALEARVVQRDGGTTRRLVGATLKGDLDLKALAGQLAVGVESNLAEALPTAQALVGDLDLGQAALRYDGTIGIGAKAQEIAAQGELRIARLTASSRQRSLPAWQPLDLTARHDVAVNLATKLATLKVAQLTVASQGAELVRAGLAQPGTLALDPTVKSLPLALTYLVKELDLASLAPLVPPSVGLTGLAGKLGVDGKADVTLQPITANVQVKTTLTGLALTKAGAGTLQPLDLESALRLDCDLQQQTAMLHQAEVKLAARNGARLALTADGQFDLALQGRPSRLHADLPEPLDLMLWQQVWVADKTKPAPTTRPAPKPAPEEPKGEPFDLKRVWLTITAMVAKVLYGEIVASNVTFAAELKDGVLKITDTGLNLNGGTVGLGALVDLRDMAVPAFDADVALKQIPLAPFMATLAPKSPVGLTGGLKDVTVKVAGKGNAWEQLKQTLIAQAALQVDQVGVNRLDGWTGTLVEQLLLQNFDLNLSDLQFSGGGGNVALAKGLLTVPNLTFDAKRVRLAWDGNVDLNHGALPNLKLAPSVDAALGQKLVGQGLKLTAQPDGMYAAPPLALKGEIWKTSNLLKLGLSYGVALGKIDAKYQGLGEGLESVEALKGLFSKPKEGATDQPKPTATDVLKGIGGAVLKATEKEQPKQPAPAEPAPVEKAPPATQPAQPAPAAPTEAKPKSEKEKQKEALEEAGRNVLKGLLGQ
jgi:hypothetical protein